MSDVVQPLKAVLLSLAPSDGTTIGNAALRSRVEFIIDEALASSDTECMRSALEELKHLQASYLNWAGKAERTSFVVDTVSPHVHERVDPASILSVRCVIYTS